MPETAKTRQDAAEVMESTIITAVQAKLSKTTKNYFAYTVEEGEDSPAVGGIYLRKETLGENPPEIINITIEK